MVDRRYLLFAMGMVSLLSAYGLFNGDQYFSAFYMLLLIIEVFISVALLMLAYMIDEKPLGKGRDYKMLIGVTLSVISIVIIVLEATFAVFSEPISVAGIEPVAAAVFLAALTALVSYAISFASRNKKGIMFYLAVGACIVVCAIIIGEIEMLILFGSAPPPGTDELVLNYYAAKLFLAGNNPYTADFSAYFPQEGVWCMLYVNGACQHRYIYPPLAFISLAPFAIFTNYQGFLQIDLIVNVAVFLAVLVLLFKSSKNNAMILLPAFLISLAMYLLEPWVISIHIAMALLLLAYVLRKRILAYPIIIGIAASVHELVWLALPFLLILSMREEGSRRTLITAAGAVLVFIAINSYFIATSANIMVQNFLNFHSELMQLFGINVFQFFVSFYPIEYNSLTLFPLLFYALILLAFFINKKTDALMCIVSTVMFVFSAMSRPPYTTMFIPLLVYLIIKKDTEKGANTSYRIRKETLYPLIGLVALVVLFMVTVIDSHEAYNAQSPPIAFGTINFNITNESNGAHALDGMVLQLGSKLTNETNGTLLIVSTKPNSIKNIRLTNFNGNASDFIYTYFNVPLQLNNITNFTRLKLFASGDHYMTSIEIPIK